MPASALVLGEREEIRLGIERGDSARDIAAALGREPSTVAREIRRNGGRSSYRAADAQARADRCRRRPRDVKLVADAALGERVTRDLKAGCSPAAIAATLRAEGAATVCAETIYTSTYSSALDVDPCKVLKRRRRRRRKRAKADKPQKPGVPNIAKRPDVVNNRSECGHWECDLVIGARNRSAVMTLIERRCRYGMILTLPDGYLAESVLAAWVDAFERIPSHLRKSVTFDQGSEWAHWQTLAATYSLDVWFCDPHAPWQRGSIENYNGHIRFWLPRGIPLDTLSDIQADHIATHLNNQPRRLLAWNAPANLYAQAAVMH